MNIGIIGTAGRKDDRTRINNGLYQGMLAHAKALVKAQTTPVKLVSGGAAVADHLAVSLYLTEPNVQLKLHLPAEFDLSRKQFVEKPGQMYEPGNIANYYHRNFAKSCGLRSLEQIAQAIQKGAEVIVTPGFKERNTKVAMESDVLIAFTFGDGALLKDGGTLDTMTKFIRRGAGQSHHVDLNTMQRFSPALVTTPTIKPPQGQLEL
jgi:hypothetical protein